MQMEKLIEYMKVDMEAESFADVMRNDPQRQNLLKLRDSILTQQEDVKKSETNIDKLNDKLEAIAEEIKKVQEQIDAVPQLSEDAAYEEVSAQRAELSKLEETLAQHITDLTQMANTARSNEKNIGSLIRSIAQKKTDYDTLKKDYEQQLKEQKTRLAQLKAKVEAAAKDVPAELMEEYNTTRQHITPPMAELAGNRCSGCNMSLPAAVASKVASGTSVCRCDTCGRILFIKA